MRHCVIEGCFKRSRLLQRANVWNWGKLGLGGISDVTKHLLVIKSSSGWVRIRDFSSIWTALK